MYDYHSNFHSIRLLSIPEPPIQKFATDRIRKAINQHLGNYTGKYSNMMLRKPISEAYYIICEFKQVVDIDYTKISIELRLSDESGIHENIICPLDDPKAITIIDKNFKEFVKCIDQISNSYIKEVSNKINIERYNEQRLQSVLKKIKDINNKSGMVMDPQEYIESDIRTKDFQRYISIYD